MKSDLLQIINKLMKIQLKGTSNLDYHRKIYKPCFKIIFINKATNQGVAYLVQPKLLKKSKKQRGCLGQLFTFFIYANKELTPSRAESVFGKNQDLIYKIDKQKDKVQIIYQLNNTQSIIKLDLITKNDKKLFQIMDKHLEPVFFKRQLAKVDKQIILPMTHFLLSTFLQRLIRRPKFFGVRDVRLTIEDTEFKRGYILFKQSQPKSLACDLLIEKSITPYTDEFINRIRLIAPDSDSFQLEELHKKFKNHVCRYSLKKLIQETTELLIQYKLILPHKVKEFYFPETAL